MDFDLNKLSNSDKELLYKAPILVCILIAGADGTIDRKEIREAIQFAEKKIAKSRSMVSALLREIIQDFEDKLKILLQHYPYDSKDRNPMLVKELAQLNHLWKRLDPEFAQEFFKTLKSISEHIAKSSGGILGYNTVASEEAKYIHLDMISNPSVS